MRLFVVSPNGVCIIEHREVFMRYYAINFDSEDHLEDLVDSAEDGHLMCIVDEEGGGIIAYVLDSPRLRRTSEIVEILNNLQGKGGRT